MSWAKVNEEKRDSAVPKAVPTTYKAPTGMGGAIARRIAKVGK